MGGGGGCDGDWVAGARLRFVSDLVPEANFGGELLVYDPPRTLEMRWGTDILRFELAADGDGTLLTLTDTLEERGTAARAGGSWCRPSCGHSMGNCRATTSGMLLPLHGCRPSPLYRS